MNYDLYMELPTYDSLHPMWMMETEDVLEAEAWCRGELLEPEHKDKLAKGYLLTAKHQGLGLKNPHGCSVEQILCLGRVMNRPRGRPPRIEVCLHSNDMSTDDGVIPRLGLKSIEVVSWRFSRHGRRLGYCWRSQHIDPRLLLALAQVSDVPDELILAAECEMARTVVGRLLPEHRDIANVIDDVQLYITGRLALEAIADTPMQLNDNHGNPYKCIIHLRADAANSPKKLDMASFVAFERASKEAAKNAARSVITIPDLVYGLIRRGHTLKM